MSDSDVLILYDIPTSNEKQKAWSPNLWKARYALNYKGIPYKTKWVEYPDIEPLCIQHGAPPTSKKADGRPHYTLPMIYDPSTKTTVIESAEIAKYLDRTYPDTPKLFPQGVEALQTMFLDWHWDNIGMPLYMNVILRTCNDLTPRSAEYFRRTREATFGKKLEELGGEKEWKDLEAALGRVDSWLKANGPGRDELFLGDKICFCDIQLVALIQWLRLECREDYDDWKRVESWHDGRWKRLVEYFDQYAAVDA